MTAKKSKHTATRRAARSRNRQITVSPDLVWNYITETETSSDTYMHSIQTKDGVTVTHTPSGVQVGPFRSTSSAKSAIASWLRKARSKQAWRHGAT